MPKGFWAADVGGHWVNAIPPVDLNGGIVNSDVWSMAKYGHASILLTLGVTGAAVTVTVEECDNFGPDNVTTIAFKRYVEETDAGDTLGAKTATAAAGFATSTNDNIMYAIEIDAAELTDGRPNLRVVLSDPAQVTLASVVVLLSGARYAQEQSPTAIV